MKEEKRISHLEMVSYPHKRIDEDGIKFDWFADFLEKQRDWLLGGQTFGWEYEKDLKTGDLILRRW